MPHRPAHILSVYPGTVSGEQYKAGHVKIQAGRLSVETGARAKCNPKKVLRRMLFVLYSDQSGSSIGNEHPYVFHE
ncbi:hypothetical protein K443DRAFT_10370 [Laccaria amethystina LaAM-08-1]|uniref:Uncharacterized protein n=1 Tax=Laccaria amethystina LaAM-08-1 TaxID=1095629 RepID=A0A0C9X671_9AGAR|nr:hypothetical protein K443DRAFT_10370 [Laccaria amethystina LaAM-08-1]